MPPFRFAIRFLALSILAVTSAAPAAAQTAPPSPPAADDKIRKIALIPAPEPLKYSAETMQGGALWRLQNGDNADKFTEALSRNPSRLAAMINDAVEAQLRAQNIEIVRIDAVRDKYQRLMDFTQIQTDADAILEIRIGTAGYFRPAWINDFAPGVLVRAQLVVASTKQKVLDDHFAYGRGHPLGGRHNFSSDYKFANLDSLREQLPRAKEGMEKGVPQIAAELAGKVGEISRGGVTAVAAAKVKSEAISNDPDAKRSDDRGSN